MTISKTQNLTNKTILLLILTIALSGIYYLANHTNIKNYKQLEQQASKTPTNSKSVVQQKEILDCAKKITNGSQLLAKAEKDNSNCLFMGCGDFFQ